MAVSAWGPRYACRGRCAGGSGRTGRRRRSAAGSSRQVASPCPCRPLRRLGVPAGLPVPASRPGAGVVHAPGGPVPARVPGGPGHGKHPRRHRPARAGGRADPAAGATATASTPPSSSATSWCRWRPSASAWTSSRARGRWWPSPSVGAPTWPGCGPSSPSPTPPTSSRRSAWSGRARPLGVPLIGFAGAPVHGGQLPGRGRAVAGLRPHQGPHARRPGLWPAARPVGRHGPGVAALPGASRGLGRAALRQLGRDPLPRRLRGATCCPPPAGSSPGWPTLGCPASTSGWAPVSCSA